MKPLSFFLFILLFNPSISVNAQESWTYKNEFGFRSDNDSYMGIGQDRYYTNGLFISFRHAMDQRKIDHKNLNKTIWEIEAGQRMYNAQSGNISDIQYVDRPFAAYLYGGLNLYWLYNSENTLKLSLQAGTIGPAAKGKEAQEFLHDTFGFYKVDGWQFQVNNAVGINTGLEYTYFVLRTENDKADISVASYVNLGTTFTAAGIGGLLRAGSLSQLFHSAITNSRTSNSYVIKPLVPTEFFVFARPMVHFVGYDATIQGGISSSKDPVTYGVKHMVLSGELGGVYASKRWTAEFSLTFKSKEVQSIAKSHQFGSASLYYRFN
jgi:lipid A 3-O-deacylase